MPHAPNTVECWTARVHGRVQGVGYRDSCTQRARELGVSGWVRNRLDGSVEVLMVGAPEQLAALRDWLHRGPPLARVDEVQLAAADAPDGAHRGFERHPTA